MTGKSPKVWQNNSELLMSSQKRAYKILVVLNICVRGMKSELQKHGLSDNPSIKLNKKSGFLKCTYIKVVVSSA